MSEVVPCGHCGETGTCRTAEDGSSCDRCTTYWRQQQQNFPKTGRCAGVVCSVCFGRGLAETASSQWDYRFPALLAVLFIAAAFGILLFFEGKHSVHFDKILVFVSTLVGSVTGYYFGGERRRNSVQVPKFASLTRGSDDRNASGHP